MQKVNGQRSPDSPLYKLTVLRPHKLEMTYEDKETVDEIKAELEETKQLLKDKIIDKDPSRVGIRIFVYSLLAFN